MTVEEILREAIQGEVESYELYTHAATLVQAEHVKDALRELAQEELKHKATLKKMLAAPDQLQAQVQALQAASVQDYKIGDHLVVRPLGPEATFQDVCIFASRKEQQSYELYRDLAARSRGQVRDLLAAMAQDELRHKNLVEGWYDEIVYQEF